MATLQNSLDELQSTVPAVSKAGNTDVIRAMLREQKKECSALHANPLFKEFRGRQKKLGAAAQEPAAPVIDDLEAEGLARLTDLIKSTAEEKEAQPAGVFASFGKPYACLGGEPVQLDKNASALLPHLNRDDLTETPLQRKQAGHRVSQPGSLILANAVAAAGDAGKGSSDEQDEAAKLLRHKTVMQFSAADRLEASFPAAAVRQANTRRKAASAHPHTFFNKDLAGADAGDAAASYGHHQPPSKNLPGQSIVKHYQEAAVAAAVQQGLNATATVHAAADGSLWPVGDRKSFFITQRAGAGHADHSGHTTKPASSGAAANGKVGAGNKHAHKVGAGHHITLPEPPVQQGTPCAVGKGPIPIGRPNTSTVHGVTPRRHRAHHDTTHSRASTHVSDGTKHESAAASVDHEAAQQVVQQPEFKPLTELVMQQPGSSNPVTGWRNEFVKVRQVGYTALQATLWQRSQERQAARGSPEGRAQLNRSLLQQLDTVRGKLTPGWVPGTVPESPFTASKQHSSAAAAAANGAAAAAMRLKESEVELLEHFFDALCGLVDRQRLSDPLSLMVVHQVKALLEGGTYLLAPLLQQLIDNIAQFCKSCGLMRYNRFILPLLVFIRKCVGVSQADFDAMVSDAGIDSVLYDDATKEAATAAACPTAEAAADGTGSTGAWATGSTGIPQLLGTAAGHMATAAHGAQSSSPSQGLGAMQSQGPSARQIDSEPATVAGSANANKRGSTLGSATGLTAQVVPPIPIDAAAAAAAADIARAVSSAPTSHRPIIPKSESVRVSKPGIARHVDMTEAELAAAAAAAAAAMSGNGSKPVARLDLHSLSAATAAESSRSPAAAGHDDPLPDLGLDEQGQPLSRRTRHEEGVASWSGAQQPQQQRRQQWQQGQG